MGPSDIPAEPRWGGPHEETELKKETALQTLLSYAVSLYPNRVAIRYGSRSIDYRELDNQSCKLASGLLRQGVQPGDRVALFVPNCPEAIMALLACFKIGAVGVPLNYRYLSEEAWSIINRTHAKLLIVHEERIEIVKSFLDKSNSLQTFVVGGEASLKSYRLVEELFSPAAPF